MKRSLLNHLFVAALIAVHMLMTACDKNPASPDNKQQPTLPPQSSMTMDLSDFNQALSKGQAETSAIGQNFVTARLTVATINLAVATILSVPTLTFVAAISQQPVLKEDGKFHWIFNVNDGPKTFKADLAGWIDVPATEAVFEMRISTTGVTPALTNFLWYEGRAKLDNKTGYWEVYDALRPASAIKVLRIDWQVADQTHANLELTAIEQGVATYGDKVTYNTNGADRTVMNYDASENTAVTIDWDAVTKAGSITAPSYKDGEKACWDSQLNDVACQ
ncbi:hypothetical protein HUU05_25945 [candidate division KSB1 bacterium]|nr:hypothetical protein [candidate division KSB1 bacterium]